MPTYLVTGTTRGLGNAILRALLLRPSSTVVATVRDPAHPAAQALPSLPRDPSSRLIVVPLDAADFGAPFRAIATLQSEHGVETLDVVIANSAMANVGTRVLETPLDSVAEHVAVNTTAPLALLQASAPLLRRSGNPKFVAVSSSLGSIGSIAEITQTPWPRTTSPYGLTKAALNWMVRTAHCEETWLTAVAVHPSLVRTDLAAAALEGNPVGIDEMGGLTPERSAEGVLDAVERASREGPGFLKWDGTDMPW